MPSPLKADIILWMDLGLRHGAENPQIFLGAKEREELSSRASFARTPSFVKKTVLMTGLTPFMAPLKLLMRPSFSLESSFCLLYVGPSRGPYIIRN